MLLWQDYSNPCKYISIQQSDRGGPSPHLHWLGLPHPWFVEVYIGSSFNCYYFATVRALASMDILWAITVEVLSLFCGACLRRYNVVPVCGCGFFFLHCRAHHYSSDGRKFRKTTTGSQHRGGEQNQKHKTTPEPPNQTQTTTQKTKQTPKKSEMDVSETVKRSKLPLSEPLRCSPQRNSLPIQLPCISHTSRSISEKVASSGSGLVPSIWSFF